jgi:RNA 3'-terminal phosphate cyclase (ATP)
MIVIDGSQGEGGGQIFRTALSLAMCLGRPVHIRSIRAGRSKPGLLRQHLTCLRAAKEISNATVDGCELGAGEVVFHPGVVSAGDYRFAVGSAGSTSLVLQTVLLPLLYAAESSTLQLEGGTHNGSAPSFDFLQHSFLPALAAMGYKVEAKLERYGFYPAGGGAWTVRMEPAAGIKALDFQERGELVALEAVATSARIPEHVTERELGVVRKKLAWPQDVLRQRIVDSHGPGNILSLRVRSENVTEIVEEVGEKQLSAERVAGRAVKAMKEYLAAPIAVGEHLADQLLLPMVLGRGGTFTTVAPSEHLRTNIAVIKQFVDTDIDIVQKGDKAWQVTVANR